MNNKRLGNLTRQQRDELLDLVADESNFRLVKFGKNLTFVVVRDMPIPGENMLRASANPLMTNLGEVASIRYNPKTKTGSTYIEHTEKSDLVNYAQRLFERAYNEVTSEK